MTGQQSRRARGGSPGALPALGTVGGLQDPVSRGGAAQAAPLVPVAPVLPPPDLPREDLEATV